jgi:hypothetical protein
MINQSAPNTPGQSTNSFITMNRYRVTTGVSKSV